MLLLVYVWSSKYLDAWGGWIQFEPDAAKRQKFMDEYFNQCLEGYRSETEIDDAMLEQLPLFIQVNLMEWIVDEFDVMNRDDEDAHLWWGL